MHADWLPLCGLQPVTSGHMSPLFRLAIASGQAETVRSYLGRGANPNARDGSGATALLLAASRGRQDICEILIDHGADTSASDNAGRTVLDYASQWGFDLRIQETVAPVELPALFTIDDIPSTEDAFPAPTLSSALPQTAIKPDRATTEAAVEAPPAFQAAVFDAVATALRLHTLADEIVESTQQATDGWEAEPDFQARKHDELRVAAAEAAHEAFSRPSAGIDASNWSQVDASLPILLGSSAPALPAPLRRLLSHALRDGRITTARIRSCLGRTKDGGRYYYPLRYALSDLGVMIDNSSLGEVLDEEVQQSSVEGSDVGLLDDAMEFVDSMLGKDQELAHVADIRSLREGSSDLQPRLWSRTEELRRRLATIFARMPGGLELLEAAGARLVADPDDDKTEIEENEEGLPEDDYAQSAAEPDVDTDAGDSDHLSNSFSGLSEVEVAKRLMELRLRPSVLEDAARRACAAKREGCDEAFAFAAELRSRVNKIVETNLSLVVWVAKRYRNKGMEPLDLIQEGSIGLMKAVERFDPSRGNTLGTYAIWWIRQSITRAMADLCRTIRIPVHLQERSRKLERVGSQLQLQLGRPATICEVAVDMDMTEEAVFRLQRLTENLVSRGDNVQSLSRAMTIHAPDTKPTPEDAMWNGKIRQEVADRLLELTPREERILRLRFGIGSTDELTLEQVGETFEVTRERIRQIEAKALLRLSRPSMSRRLKGILFVQ